MRLSRSTPIVLIFGALLVAVSSAVAADGKAVYDRTCAACHATGVANAPRLGDQAAWAPRLAGGTAALLGSVLKGKGAMPPKAGSPALTEAEIRAAIDYMVAASTK